MRFITSRNICVVCKIPPRSTIARVCIRRNDDDGVDDVLCGDAVLVVADVTLVRRFVVRVAAAAAVVWEDDDDDTRRTTVVVRLQQEARMALVRIAIIFFFLNVSIMMR